MNLRVYEKLKHFLDAERLVASQQAPGSLSAMLDVRFSNCIPAADIIRIYISFQSIRGRNYFEGCLAGRITCKCLYGAKASVDAVMKFQGTYLGTEEIRRWRKTHFNIILNLYQGLSSRLFPSGFSIKTSHGFLFSLICATCTANFTDPDLIILFLFGDEYKLLRYDFPNLQ
jgi:hypothetical protein